MTTSHLTKHAILRMSQRGIRSDDLAILDLFGTEVEGGTMLLRRDAEVIERQAKKLIQRVWRLVGKRCVSHGDTTITAYHATRGKERRLLRRA